jgi:signal peptidase I
VAAEGTPSAADEPRGDRPGQGSGQPTGAEPPVERKPRSPRHIRGAARMLQKEARRILKHHGSRIAAEPADAMYACLAAIDTQRTAQNWPGVEQQAERLDELLHQHASFARKSALRETLENVGIAVMVALGLRSCFYEPFKIPSGSMMPTLRAGDHIFVNKFVYGVQIPFTTTVVGGSVRDIERGEVVVFRYPLDPSEDFIKRVIGLPGDEIRVAGREVAIRRSGETEFSVLERKPVSERCLDDTGTKTMPNCQLLEETIDGHTYVVRYLLNIEDHDDLAAKPRVWKVPEGHLLVMGDNRNQSHDSTQWKVNVEAVGADHLLSLTDLRDLTSDTLFTMQRDDELIEQEDGRHDSVTYLASHRSESHDVMLEVWRKPTLGREHVFETAAAGLPGGKPTTVAELLAGAEGGAERDRALEVGAGVDRLVVSSDADQRQAVVLLEQADAVLHVSCGAGVCRDDAKLGLLLGEVIAKFHRNHAQDARVLLEPPKAVRYTTHWSGRSDAREHFFERKLVKPGSKAGAAGAARDTVRIRAFRKPAEGTGFVRDAALRAFGSGSGSAERIDPLGDDALRVQQPEATIFVMTDAVREIVVVLECGAAFCTDPAKGVELAKQVAEGMPAAAGDRRKLRVLLTAGEVPGWEELPVGAPELAEFDRVRLEGTVRGREHTLEIEAWLRPEEGLGAKVTALGTALGLAADSSIAAGGYAGENDDAFTFVFGVAESSSVVRLACRKGLCPSRESALALAHRAAAKAVDPSSFVDPDAERPRPFVPRGNVKGRAERIWLPLSRFWLPIR